MAAMDGWAHTLIGHTVMASRALSRPSACGVIGRVGCDGRGRVMVCACVSSMGCGCIILSSRCVRGMGLVSDLVVRAGRLLLATAASPVVLDRMAARMVKGGCQLGAANP